MTTEQLHTVDYDANTQEVVFICAGDESAACHNYPDGLESWDLDTDRDLFKPHERCWMFDWFDNHAVEYTGDGGIQADDSYGNTVPSESRTGLITGGFEGGYIEWEWLP